MICSYANETNSERIPPISFEPKIILSKFEYWKWVQLSKSVGLLIRKLDIPTIANCMAGHERKSGLQFEFFSYSVYIVLNLEVDTECDECEWVQITVMLNSDEFSILDCRAPRVRSILPTFTAVLLAYRCWCVLCMCMYYIVGHHHHLALRKHEWVVYDRQMRIGEGTISLNLYLYC